MFILMDDWLNFWNAIIICLLEVVIVSWVYGIDKFCHNIEEMGVKSVEATKLYFKVSFRFIVPIILVILLIGSLTNLTLSKASIHGMEYVFEEPYVQALAWLMGIFTISFIPCFALWQLYSTFKVRKTIDWGIFKPTSKWRPQNWTHWPLIKKSLIFTLVLAFFIWILVYLILHFKNDKPEDL